MSCPRKCSAVLFTQEPACSPFIPTRDEQELRFDLHRLLELFLEVDALAGMLLSISRFVTVMKGASDVGGWVFCHRYREFFGDVLVQMPAIILWRVIEPWPFVFAIPKPSFGIGPCPRFTDGEAITNVRWHFVWFGEDERLARPSKPQVRKMVGAIQVIIKSLCCGGGRTM